ATSMNEKYQHAGPPIDGVQNRPAHPYLCTSPQKHDDAVIGTLLSSHTTHAHHPHEPQPVTHRMEAWKILNAKRSFS
ncbi:hypothetical protein, partial [Corynebacterium tapiri]